MTKPATAGSWKPRQLLDYWFADITDQSTAAEVQTAIKVWGTKDENKNAKGYSDLLEAASIAHLFELSLGGGAPLPSEFKALLKYKPKEQAESL